MGPVAKPYFHGLGPSPFQVNECPLPLKGIPIFLLDTIGLSWPRSQKRLLTVEQGKKLEVVLHKYHDQIRQVVFAYVRNYDEW